MKLMSWNVNGIRAAVGKGALEDVRLENPDVICFQETKAQDDQVAVALEEMTAYYCFSNSAMKKGYSGTAILTKEKPLAVSPDMGIESHDMEGRVLAAEYPGFYLVTVYVPNSGQGLVRLDYRKGWDGDFLNYLKKLDEKKPVIVCGDFNVCHKEIDIARPKPNYNKTAGYTQVEIDGMDNFIGSGLADTFRNLHPDTVAYSWWSFRAGARQKNIGWRLDYFLISKALMSSVESAEIHPEIFGSDHCPVSVQLSV